MNRHRIARKIFVSYRRADSAAIVGRLYDRLVARYGADAVFVDIDSVPFATDFRENIREAIERSGVMLAVVGRHWRGDAGHSDRLMDRDDLVRIEIETALAAPIAVLPLLVDGAMMPSAAELPPGLARFAFLNAMAIGSDRDFHYHVDKLCESVDALLGSRQPRFVLRQTGKGDDHRGNLPFLSGEPVGRQQESEELVSALTAARAVTLVGPGGIGKTTLALHVARTLASEFPDGIWFVDLSTVTDDAAVPRAILETLRKPAPGEDGALERMASAFRRKRALIVLDNCEHVVSGAAVAAIRLLRSCFQIRIVATSREPLGIDGERVMRLGALALPPRGQAIGQAELLSYASAQLFVKRAQGARKTFAVDGTNADCIVEILHRLDGIALAIELAAARIGVLTPDQLLKRLDERLRLLVTRSRSALPRHRTLEATIAWSYDLLPQEEQFAFRLLSIFSGGCTFELAVSVLSPSGANDLDTLDRLSSLVDKSLVTTDADEAGLRYRLLESTREFARQELRAHGEEERAQATHAAAYLRLAERLATDTAPAAIDAAARELENWRSALHWCLEQRGDVHMGCRLAAVLRFAWMRWAPVEGRRWLAAASAQLDQRSDPDLRRRLFLADAALALPLSQHKAAWSSASAALSLAAAPEDAEARAEAQLYGGAALGFMGSKHEGEDLLTAALATFRSIGDERQAGAALQYLAMLQLLSGDVAGARPLFEQALGALRRAGLEASAAHMAVNLAEVEHQAGDTIRALELAREALVGDRARGEPNAVVFDLCNIAAYLIALGRSGEATVAADEALAVAQSHHLEKCIILALQRKAAIAALFGGEAVATGRLAAVARMLGFVDTALNQLGTEPLREYTEQSEYDRVLAALTAAIGEERLRDLMREGGCYDVDRATRELVPRLR